MEKRLKPELVKQGLENLTKAMQGEYREKGIHSSDLIYCLTKSWFEKKQPLKPTPDETMLFSIGWGLQKALFPPEQQHSPIEVDGIICSPDYHSKDGAAELKTTRMSSAKEDLPETWIKQIMSYCHVTGQWRYDLLVLHLMGNYKPPFPVLQGFELEFTDAEISAHWMWMLTRKDVLMLALQDGLPPTPYQYCEKWECKSCRYSIRCEAIQTILGEKDA